MRPILTSDQFVAGILSVLALRKNTHFVFAETEIDARFQSAFEELCRRESELSIQPNFTFYVDPIHNDSTALRDTLLAARDKELITINNPTFRTFDIKVDEQRANRYLERNPLPRGFLEELVEKYFSKAA